MRVIETGVKEFKIGIENELRKDQHFREGIRTSKEDQIKKENTLLRLPAFL